jgi:hypothetical protein
MSRIVLETMRQIHETMQWLNSIRSISSKHVCTSTEL